MAYKEFYKCQNVCQASSLTYCFTMGLASVCSNKTTAAPDTETTFCTLIRGRSNPPSVPLKCSLARSPYFELLLVYFTGDSWDRFVGSPVLLVVLEHGGGAPGRMA